MPKAKPSPAYAPTDLDLRVLSIREKYEKEYGIPSLAKAKVPFYGFPSLGYPNYPERHNMLELLEALARMVRYKTKEEQHSYRYNVGAYQLLMTACFVVRKHIENEEYNMKHKTYGVLHKLLGEALDIPHGNKLENEILTECLLFVEQLNPTDYDMPGEFKITPKMWSKLKNYAAVLKSKIEMQKSQPGFCEKTLGYSGYVLAPFGWAFGYFAGVAFSFSTAAAPMTNALGVVFSGLFGLAARQGGGSGRTSSMLLSRPCAERVASYGFGYAGAMTGSVIAFHAGKKAGGFLGWLIDSGSDMAATRIKAMMVVMKSKEKFPVRYGYNIETGDLVFFNVDGDLIDMSDVLSAKSIEALIKSGSKEKFSDADNEMVQAFVKELEQLRPELQKLEEQRADEEARAEEVSQALANA